MAFLLYQQQEEMDPMIILTMVSITLLFQIQHFLIYLQAGLLPMLKILMTVFIDSIEVICARYIRS